MQPTCCVPLQPAASSDARVVASQHVCTWISGRACARARKATRKTCKPNSMPEPRLLKDASPSSDTQQALGLLPPFSQHLPPAFTQTPIFIYKSSHTRARAGRHSLQYFPLPMPPLTRATSVRVLLRLEGGYLGLITAALLLMTDCVT